MHTLTPNIVIDTVPLLPTFLQTNLSYQLREFYITTYRDKFFEDPPTWFTVFIWMELLYHLPLSIWATRGLLKGNFFKPPFSQACARTYIVLVTMYILVSWSIQSSPSPYITSYPLHIYIKCNIRKSDYIPTYPLLPEQGITSSKQKQKQKQTQ